MPQNESGMAFDSGSADKPQDFNEEGKSGISAKYLMEEYDLSRKRNKSWHINCQEITKKYEAAEANLRKGKSKNRHNILYSNTETQRPSLYTDKPIPDVRRRYRDKDPVARRIAEMTERALEFAMDDYDWDDLADDCVLDFLLYGRPMTRVRYLPEFKKVDEEREDLDLPEGAEIPEDAEYDEERQVHFYTHPAYEELTSEKVGCELVQWDRFQHGSGRKWEELPWVSYDHYFTKDEFEENFPDFKPPEGKELRYGVDDTETRIGMNSNTQEDKKRDAAILKKIKIIEFWYKPTREIFFVAAVDTVLIKTEKDMLGLTGFFPSPKPVYAIGSTSNIVPVPEYMMYKDQSDELDKITMRIQKVISAIKARGVYDSSLGIERLFAEDDNKLIPANNTSRFVETGGLSNGIWMLPIEIYAQVLQQLYVARDQTKEVIYEIIGLSDIVRGASDPRETKGAQQIKSQWASSRIKKKQYRIQKYFRDILRMKAEIISTKFSPETIEAMTGLSFEVEGDVDPKTGQRQILSPAEQTIEMMQDDVVREYRVDVETDSTIATMIEADQQNVNRLLQGIAQYVQGMGGAVTSGFIPPKSATAILLAGIRKYKFGREVEDAIEAIGDQPPPDQNKEDPEVAKQKALLQIKQQEFELKAKDMQMKGQLKQQESQAGLQMDQQEAQMEAQIAMTEMRAEIQLEKEKMQNELQMQHQEMLEKLEIEREKMKGMLQIEKYKVDSMPKPAQNNGGDDA